MSWVTVAQVGSQVFGNVLPLIGQGKRDKKRAKRVDIRADKIYDKLSGVSDPYSEAIKGLNQRFNNYNSSLQSLIGGGSAYSGGGYGAGGLAPIVDPAVVRGGMSPDFQTGFGSSPGQLPQSAGISPEVLDKVRLATEMQSLQGDINLDRGAEFQTEFGSSPGQLPQSAVISPGVLERISALGGTNPTTGFRQADDTGAPNKKAPKGIKGAVKKVASAGKGEDEIVAHINPREAEMLRQTGGSGMVNPRTGIMEFNPTAGQPDMRSAAERKRDSMDVPNRYYVSEHNTPLPAYETDETWKGGPPTTGPSDMRSAAERKRDSMGVTGHPQDLRRTQADPTLTTTPSQSEPQYYGPGFTPPRESPSGVSIAQISDEYSLLGNQFGALNPMYQALGKSVGGEYDALKGRYAGQETRARGLADRSIFQSGFGADVLGRADRQAISQNKNLLNMANLTGMSDAAILAGQGNIAQTQGNVASALAGQNTGWNRMNQQSLQNLMGAQGNLIGQAGGFQGNILGQQRGVIGDIVGINRDRQNLLSREAGIYSNQAANDRAQIMANISMAKQATGNYTNAYNAANELATASNKATAAQQQALTEGLSGIDYSSLWGGPDANPTMTSVGTGYGYKMPGSDYSYI